MYYKQKNYFDAIGKTAYTELYNFVFNCELLDIANDKIRIHYWIPINDPKYKARFTHSIGPYEDPSMDLDIVFFKRSSEFSA